MSGHYVTDNERQLQDAAEAAVDHARRLGVPEAAVQASSSGGVVLRGAGGEIESATRQGATTLAVRLIDHGRQGYASSASYMPEAIRETVERAKAIVDVVAPDPEIGLTAASAQQTPDVELWDTAWPGDEGLISDLHALLRTSTTSELNLAAIGSEERVFAVATSNGFSGASRATSGSRAAIVVARSAEGAVRDLWSSVDRRYGDLDPIETVVARATARAEARLGGRKVKTGDYAVIFDASVAPTLIGAIVDGLGGAAQHAGAHFLARTMNQSILPASLSLSENPFEPYGMSSAGFDSEGVVPKVRNVIERGVVRGYFVNASDARRLGIAPTGHANGPYNLTLLAEGPAAAGSLADVQRRMGEGLLVTTVNGRFVDPVSGAFSATVEGLWIRNGEPDFPVAGVTVGGAFKDMLAGIEAVGTDRRRSGAITTGSILISSMRISGSEQ